MMTSNKFFVLLLLTLHTQALQVHGEPDLPETVHVQAQAQAQVAMDEMVCEQQEDESILCSFRISSDRNIHIDVPSKQSKMKACLDTTCVNVRATLSKHAPADPDKEEIRVEQDGVLYVGKATYQKPYSQYGPHVAKLLQRAPTQHAHVVDWANWYLQLGTAHLGYDASSHNPEPPVEPISDWALVVQALNAMKQAIQVLVRADPSDVPVEERDPFVASVHFQMGEAYFMDPDLGHILEALEQYQAAKDIYHRLIHTTNHHAPLDDWERRYADACTKTGIALVASIDPMEQQPEWMAGYMEAMAAAGHVMNGANEDSYEETLDPLAEEPSDRIPARQALAEAEQSFETAIALYEKHLKRYKEQVGAQHIHEWDKLEQKMGYSIALQNGASTATMVGNLERAKEYTHKCIGLHLKEILPTLDPWGQDHFNSRVVVADMYIGLADTALQLGEYDNSKEAYKKAMDWHQQHNIDVAPMQEMMMEDDQALLDYQQQLQEYRAAIQAGGKLQNSNLYPEGNSQEDMYIAADDGYEADLLVSLGALYMSRGENAHAITYFEQAVELYEENKREDKQRSMADVKINLAMAYYRSRKFAESTKTHVEALDIYHGLYGDGVNPYLQGMEEYEKMIYTAMGASTGASLQGSLQEQPNGEKKGPNKSQIDIEKYKQSIVNATEAVPKPSKEEL